LRTEIRLPEDQDVTDLWRDLVRQSGEHRRSAVILRIGFALDTT